MQQGARCIIVLLNNGMYGTIRMHQEREYPTRVEAARSSSTPTSSALAQAYGYEGTRITRTEEFEPALVAALERRQGTLIEVMLETPEIRNRGTLTGIRDAALKKGA